MTEQVSKPLTIIVDIDNTLNIQDEKLLRECEEAEGFNWEKYKLYLQILPSREYIIEMVNNFYDDGYNVAIVTARKFSEEFEDLTELDLESRGVKYNDLYMMPPRLSEKCTKANYQVVQASYKEGVLNHLLKTDEVVLVIDDLKGFCAYAAGLGICTVNPLLEEY